MRHMRGYHSRYKYQRHVLFTFNGDTGEDPTVDINTKDMHLFIPSGDTGEDPTVDINTKDLYLCISNDDTNESSKVDICSHRLTPNGGRSTLYE